jgi:hypothetical protein
MENSKGETDYISSIRSNKKNILFDINGLWSYPIFVRSETKEVLWLFFVSKMITDAKLKTTYVFRPFASILAVPNTNQVIQYQHYKLGQDPFPDDSWEKPLSKFPHDSIKNLTIKEFEEKERVLSSFYTKDTQLFEEKNEISGELKELYIELCSPHFLDFIKCLAPEFYVLIMNKD